METMRICWEVAFGLSVDGSWQPIVGLGFSVGGPVLAALRRMSEVVADSRASSWNDREEDMGCKPLFALRLMIEILHDLKDPKLREFWYSPYYG